MWQPELYNDVVLGTVVDQIQRDKEGLEESKEETKDAKIVDSYITGDVALLNRLTTGLSTNCWQIPPEELQQ